MICIAGSRHDPTVEYLLTRWPDARWLSPLDLTRAGWSFRSDRPDGGAAVLDGQVVETAAITAVFMRLPAIRPDELLSIRSEDRVYVATESTAFLLGWLAHLRCPVVNSPTPGCLLGPLWRSEGWLDRAARLGLPTGQGFRGAPMHTAWAPAAPIDGQVTIIGRRSFGDAPERCHRSARTLVAHAGAKVAEVYFSGERVVSVSLLPGITTPERADALHEVMLGSRGEP